MYPASLPRRKQILKLYDFGGISKNYWFAFYLHFDQLNSYDPYIIIIFYIL